MIRGMNDESDWSKVKIYKHTPDTHLNTETMQFEGEELLDIKCDKDLLPYGAFLVGCSYGDQDGTYIAHIGSRSFVDQEEEERFTWYLREVQRLYRRCKRKKIEFTEEYVQHELSWISDKETISEMYRRVKEHPTSANVKGLHDNLHQHYRRRLAEEMVKAGYTQEQADEWVYNNNKTW